MPLILKSLSAIVSGGNSGLGLATVKKLLENGTRVGVCDLSDSNLKNLKGNIIFHKTDITKEAEVKAAIDAICNKHEGLHTLINCAGIGHAERVFNDKKQTVHSLENFKQVLEVNTFGTFNMIRLCIPKIAENKPIEDGERGCIINTASVAAFEGQIGQAAYSASKGAIVGMTLPLARDLSRIGIRVMTIAPGLFETPLLEGLPASVKTHLGSLVPFPSRLGHPEEFARLVSAIIENPMLNGETIRIDGALRMPP